MKLLGKAVALMAGAAATFAVGAYCGTVGFVRANQAKARKLAATREAIAIAADDTDQ